MKSEFEEAGSLLEANRDAVTISIEDEKQRQATGTTVDENPLDTDDKTEVGTRQTY